MRGLANKAILVAGGGGIGAATARRLSEEGARVVLGDIDFEQAQIDAAEITASGGGEVSALPYDQADERSIIELVERAVAKLGGLDGLHANAADLAISRQDENVMTTDPAVWDRTMSVNARGPTLLTRHALPHLVKARGAIVYTSSGSVYVGEPSRFAYAMSKSALNALMRHVASRWGGEGVRANAISPGLILGRHKPDELSEELRAVVTTIQRLPIPGEPEHIAAMVAMLLSDDAAWITGQVIAVDGGSTIRA
jgi:NAD(P)-dependent dehydrogenase (short-subunit alcohol dehydrogenase family)